MPMNNGSNGMDAPYPEYTNSSNTMQNGSNADYISQDHKTDYISQDGKSDYKDSVKKQKHYATMDDLVSEMEAKFPEIVDMSNAAFNMSLAAQQMGQTELAMGLADVGYELYTHAHFMKHEMKEFGVMPKDNQYRDYKALKGRVNRFRR